MNAIIQAEQPRQATIREQFAMAALTGLLAARAEMDNFEDYARIAWQHADAMMRKRPMPKREVA